MSQKRPPDSPIVKAAVRVATFKRLTEPTYKKQRRAVVPTEKSGLDRMFARKSLKSEVRRLRGTSPHRTS